MQLRFLCLLSFVWPLASATVLLPRLHSTSLAVYSQSPFRSYGEPSRRGLNGATDEVAMAIPGYSVGEQVLIGGMLNFLQLYNFIITARVLLSWFPQAQGVSFLQPVYTITDPYLNLFRGLIPPLGGLDLSPIVAFFTLNVLSSTTASIGCEIPDSKSSVGVQRRYIELCEHKEKGENIQQISPYDPQTRRSTSCGQKIDRLGYHQRKLNHLHHGQRALPPNIKTFTSFWIFRMHTNEIVCVHDGMDESIQHDR